MYGLPANTDLSPLRGKELVQLRIGAHEVQLHFSDGRTTDASVCAEGAFRMILDDGRALDFARNAPDRAEPARWLARLIGKSITLAGAVPPGTLHLRFSNGWSIEIMDDDTHYESYRIDLDGRSIVV